MIVALRTSAGGSSWLYGLRSKKVSMVMIVVPDSGMIIPPELSGRDVFTPVPSLPRRRPRLRARQAMPVVDDDVGAIVGDDVAAAPQRWMAAS